MNMVFVWRQWSKTLRSRRSKGGRVRVLLHTLQHMGYAEILFIIPLLFPEVLLCTSNDDTNFS